MGNFFGSKSDKEVKSPLLKEDDAESMYPFQNSKLFE
jgi:hypothetical protein